MATYTPPLENLAIFDNLVFLDDEAPLTYAIAKKKFLRYPYAQGTENLLDINVSGVSTFANNIIQNGTHTITQTDNSSNTLPNTFRPSNFYGDINVYKPTNAQGGAVRLWDVGSNSGKSTQLYHSGNLFQIKNLVNTGKIYIWNLDNTGADAQTLTLQGETGGVGYVGINKTSPTVALDINGQMLINNNFNSTAVMPASNNSSTLVPTTAWVQSAIANNYPLNPSYNSVSISANPLSAASTSGIYNQTNQGGFYGQFPYSTGTVQTIVDYGSSGLKTTDRPIKIQFTNNNPATAPSMANNLSCCVFEIDIFFYNYSGNSWGQTTCKLVIFRSALLTNWGNTTATETSYNINNAINGNSNFTYVDATFAPNGRQYWTYDQKFSGVTNNAYLSGKTISANVYQISINPIFPTSSYNFYYSIKNLSTNPAQFNGNGVSIFS